MAESPTTARIRDNQDIRRKTLTQKRNMAKCFWGAWKAFGQPFRKAHKGSQTQQCRMPPSHSAPYRPGPEAPLPKPSRFRCEASAARATRMSPAMYKLFESYKNSGAILQQYVLPMEVTSNSLEPFGSLAAAIIQVRLWHKLPVEDRLRISSNRLNSLSSATMTIPDLMTSASDSNSGAKVGDRLSNF